MYATADYGEGLFIAGKIAGNTNNSEQFRAQVVHGEQ
jgi:hypothetical protein